jgi:hypothetical protein
MLADWYAEHGMDDSERLCRINAQLAQENGLLPQEDLTSLIAEKRKILAKGTPDRNIFCVTTGTENVKGWTRETVVLYRKGIRKKDKAQVWKKEKVITFSSGQKLLRLCNQWAENYGAQVILGIRQWTPVTE